METAVIYARYSCSNQTEQSIEGQIRVCEDFAQRKNIVIVGSYIDRATTGTNDKRPEFQKMIKDSAKNNWNYVIVYQLDRFARNRYDSAIYKTKLKANNVKVLSAQENISDDASGILMESVLEGMAEYYSKELSQKTKRGMFENRQKGLFQGGNLLYGYKVVNKKIEIDEQTCDAVKYIFKQYSLGFSAKSISNGLAQQGYFKNGKPFNSNQIYNIVRNEKYVGAYRHGEEYITNMYPQIISKDLFEYVQSKLKTNKVGSVSNKQVYLFKNKLKCGYCGMNINADCGKNRNGVIRYYYNCYGRKKRVNDCKKAIIPKETLEEFLVNAIIEELANPSVIETITDATFKYQKQLIKENHYLLLLQSEKEQNQKVLNNYLKAIEEGVITKSTTAKIQELEQKLEDLEFKILQEKSKEVNVISKEEIMDYYIKSKKYNSLSLINYIVKEIKLFDDKVEITFNSPLNISPDTNQGFLFCRKIRPIARTIHYKLCPELQNVIIEMYV